MRSEPCRWLAVPPAKLLAVPRNKKEDTEMILKFGGVNAKQLAELQFFASMPKLRGVLSRPEYWSGMGQPSPILRPIVSFVQVHSSKSDEPTSNPTFDITLGVATEQWVSNGSSDPNFNDDYAYGFAREKVPLRVMEELLSIADLFEFPSK